jgi:hypothetical protein
MLTSVLHNLYGFLGELSILGHETAKRNRDDIKNQHEMTELSHRMIEYIEQVHLEIPSLADCKFRFFKESTQKVFNFLFVLQR